MPAGILITRLASVFTSSAKAPYMVNAITRSPGVKPFTSGPTVLMGPARRAWDTQLHHAGPHPRSGPAREARGGVLARHTVQRERTADQSTAALQPDSPDDDHRPRLHDGCDQVSGRRRIQ